jgi:HSP20 family molecular chaperone IbpA
MNTLSPSSDNKNVTNVTDSTKLNNKKNNNYKDKRNKYNKKNVNVDNLNSNVNNSNVNKHTNSRLNVKELLFELNKLKKYQHSPKVDLYECDELYIINVELPGVFYEDIKIDLYDNQILLVSGIKHNNICNQPIESKLVVTKTIYSECRYLNFMRRIKVPSMVDKNTIFIKMLNGVLTIQVNKYKESTNKESTNKESTNKESTNKESTNKESTNKESTNKESTNKESINKESTNKESTNKESTNKESTNKESTNKESTNKESKFNDSDKIESTNWADDFV